MLDVFTFSHIKTYLITITFEIFQAREPIPFPIKIDMGDGGTQFWRGDIQSYALLLNYMQYNPFTEQTKLLQYVVERVGSYPTPFPTSHLLLSKISKAYTCIHKEIIREKEER